MKLQEATESGSTRVGDRIFDTKEKAKFSASKNCYQIYIDSEVIDYD